jgi:Ca2+-binding RTX toxin-like protein
MFEASFIAGGVTLLDGGTHTDATNTIIGGAGDDRLVGTDQGDRIEGRGGDDILVGGLGANLLVGGAGRDTVSYAHAPKGGVSVDLLTHQGFSLRDQGAIDDHYRSIENVIGSAYGDGMGGDDKANLLRGGAGDDFVSGLGGADTLDGGRGYDTSSFFATEGATVDLRITGPQNTGEGMDVLISIEGLYGSFEADHLTGNDRANGFLALDGDDVVLGLGGADTLNGGSGSNTLDGGAGRDLLIVGGHDDLTGGTGADVFQLDGLGADGARIEDLGGHDVIDLAKIDADSTQAGHQAFTLVEHFTGAAGQLAWSYDPGADISSLQADRDGDGEADFAITATGEQTGFANFIL